jgi:hypothetical protein
MMKNSPSDERHFTMVRAGGKQKDPSTLSYLVKSPYPNSGNDIDWLRKKY